MTTYTVPQSTIPNWGVDARAEDRPGVPHEAPPSPAHVLVATIEPQPTHVRVLHRSDMVGLTPVFGTAQPPRGMSGLLRRLAYRIPDHHARHWLLLMFADRVDVAESAVSDVVRRRPFIVGGIAAGVVGSVLLYVAARHRK